jgi:protein-S-isoprenylcysteine O-methyltransferase Ste14
MMSDLSIYLLAYSILLAYGIIILRIVIRRDYSRQGRLSVTTSILQSLLFFLYGGFPLFYVSDDWPAVYGNLLVQIVGVIFIVAGLGFLFYTMNGLGVFRSLGLGKKTLEQAGIYRKTRNPQALACSLYVVGFAILWPSWYAAAWAILYFVLIFMMILAEEEHLLTTHGEAYLNYCREVPRFFSLRTKSSNTTA